MRYSIRMVFCMGLSMAIHAGAQIVDFGTWDMSSSEKAMDAGIGSLSVTRDGVHTPRNTWTVYVEVSARDASSLGSMEFKWPSEKSSDLTWTKPSGESYAFRLESEGLPSMEFEDVAAGELVRWDWLCDIEAVMQSHKGRIYKNREEIDAAIEESHECTRQVSVTGTDMGFQEALDHYRPIWGFIGKVEGMVRTRMGFSNKQLNKKRKEARDAQRLLDPGFLKLEFCPGSQEEHCAFPNPPLGFEVIGEGFEFGGEDPQLECCLEAWEDADGECFQRTLRDCCAVNTCVTTNFGCPPLCICQRIGVVLGCISLCV